MSARRLARILTRLYAEEMTGHMEPAQFGLLQMMEHMQHCTQAGLVDLQFTPLAPLQPLKRLLGPKQ